MRLIGLFLALALAAASTWAQCLPFTPQPAGLGADEILQEFKVDERVGTAWKVRWGIEKKWGVYIRGAWFKRNLSEPWMRVLYDARISQIFVPYHDGDPLRRLRDVNQWAHPAPLGPELVAPCGGLAPPFDYSQIFPPQDFPHLAGLSAPILAQEVRNYGFTYMLTKRPADPGTTKFRRGQALVLWSIHDTGNYIYIVEYAFRDDGAITFRLGSTGFNNQDFRHLAHMHTAVWRVDVDLAGFPADSALLHRHTETAAGNGRAVDQRTAFGGGVEAGVDWRAEEFTTVVIEDQEVENRAGHNISYEVLGQYGGTARHYRPGEDYLRHDFWVTRWRADELSAENLPAYVSGESVASSDLVLWVMTANHHLPRDEDFGFPNRTGEEVDPVFAGDRELRFNVGSALVMWSGFMLRPRNFFDGTPLVPPIIFSPPDRHDPDDLF